MDALRIVGSGPLHGTLAIRGAKNAALPLLAASLLSDAPLTLNNVPLLADIKAMIELLAQHGVIAEKIGERSVRLTAAKITNTTAPYELVRKMRASVLVLGPLLARMGQARVSLPGGCAIGTRPVDLHIKGLQQLGAVITLEDGYIVAAAPKGLKGADVVFPLVSVGATENLLMAATLAQGTTRLINAALEPEITDLAHCLVAMGARISGIGTSTLVIEGVAQLGAATHNIVSDRIELGTFAIAACMTGGALLLTDSDMALLPGFWPALQAAGAVIMQSKEGIHVSMQGRPQGVDISTAPHPGFPTDLQAQFMALMCLAEGSSRISENIFENRYMHVPELVRMGADISVQHGTAVVRGVAELRGAPVMATDLRASSSLLLAGLVAQGETLIQRIYHLDRGYERIEQRLAACGAQIERIRQAA